MRTYSGKITELKENQVFVFGSNLDGFHGAGAAGFASFGIAGNQWRNFDYANKPNGWKGKWNIKGSGIGLQQGTEGWSYALPTVTKAGKFRSLNEGQIEENIKALYYCARINLDREFLIAYTGDGSRLLNGYQLEEMAEMFVSAGPIPDNIVFEEEFAKLVEIYENKKDSI
jgi:hypothetical protein